LLTVTVSFLAMRAETTWAFHIAWFVRESFLVTVLPNQRLPGMAEEEAMAHD
jgi:hypothetical protein